MSNSRLKRIVVSALLCLASSIAQAALIEETIGDQDGLDLALSEGDAFDFAVLLGSPPEEGNSDTWVDGSSTFQFTLDLTGLNVAALQLEIAAGGQCTVSGGPCNVLVDGALAGTLQQGFLSGVGNIYVTTLLDITGLISAFDGSTPVTVELDAFDGWAMDYATVRATLAQVPEPSVLATLVIGLAGLGFAGRRMKA